MNQNEKAIAALLANDQEALNQSDTNSVMKLYASHDVFIQQHSPSSGGADAIRKAYDAVFNTIKLDVDFKVAEVHQIGPRLGFCAHQLGRSWSRQPARAVRRPTKSSSCSTGSTTPGRSRAIAFPQPSLRAHKQDAISQHSERGAQANWLGAHPDFVRFTSSPSWLHGGRGPRLAPGLECPVIRRYSFGMSTTGSIRSGLPPGPKGTRP